jgi:uncharacterized protein with GYD domain
VKYLVLIKLSDDGRKRFAEADKLFVASTEIVEKLGGKLLQIYALSSRYDFVAISEYPTPEAAFESRLKHIELGIFDRFEYHEAFDMDLFLAKV